MKRVLFSLLLVVFVFAAGCDSGTDNLATPTAGEQEENIVDLNSPTGGFSFSDEEPAFGESDLYTYSSKEPVYNDALENDPEIERWRERQGIKKFRLRAIWGRLARSYEDSTAADCCGLDWSGSMTFDNGVVIIEKLIAFDPEDYITRRNKSTIEWVSHTCPHIDGIQVKLIAPPFKQDSLEADSTETCEPVLTIKTGPFTKSFTLKELESLQLMQPVDRCGNGSSINSQIIPPGCPHGYLFGKWENVETDTTAIDSTTSPPDSTDSENDGRILLGHFRGVWIGHNGRIAGHVKGIYGINSLGERVFFGKYIDFKGHFKGILRGHFEPTPEITAEYSFPHGIFHGKWFGKNFAQEGRLKGNWISDKDGHGLFHGEWGKNCSNTI